jgi:membrane-associated phospholipid phosphatase
MFNTEWNHYLQQFDSPVIYWFMEIISFLGRTTLLTLMVYFLIAFIDFRKGFGVAHIFLYVLVVTMLLKHSIDFPRPLAVDPSLKNYGELVGPDLTHIKQPGDFWELFSEEILIEIRKGDIGRYGWPSGHVTLITAIFLGSALIFRRRLLFFVAWALIILTMISRMYLARHYLGDVLGGLVIGTTFTWLIYYLWNSFSLSTVNRTDKKQRLFLLFPLLFLLIAGYLPSFALGSLIGFNLAFLGVIFLWGVPEYSTNILKRIGAILVFFITGYVSLTLTRKIGLPDYTIMAAAAFMLSTFMAFMISSWICFKTSLWSKKSP